MELKAETEIKTTNRKGDDMDDGRNGSGAAPQREASRRAELPEAAVEMIRQRYRHSLSRRPAWFCDSVTAVRRREDAAYWLKLGRERVRDAAAVGSLTATRLIDLAALEMMEAAVRGDKAAAVGKCYDAIAVLLRTVDVLEGRQPLGKPKETKTEAAS